ncbi:MAG: tyrosine-protein phosphatase [Chlamydiae bacterium]|nr:tyrosine-protein phosphatase [Chlamydiota bacterium]
MSSFGRSTGLSGYHPRVSHLPPIPEELDEDPTDIPAAADSLASPSAASAAAAHSLPRQPAGSAWASSPLPSVALASVLDAQLHRNTHHGQREEAEHAAAIALQAARATDRDANAALEVAIGAVKAAWPDQFNQYLASVPTASVLTTPSLAASPAGSAWTTSSLASPSAASAAAAHSLPRQPAGSAWTSSSLPSVALASVSSASSLHSVPTSLARSPAGSAWTSSLASPSAASAAAAHSLPRSPASSAWASSCLPLVASASSASSLTSPPTGSASAAPQDSATRFYKRIESEQNESIELSRKETAKCLRELSIPPQDYDINNFFEYLQNATQILFTSLHSLKIPVPGTARLRPAYQNVPEYHIDHRFFNFVPCPKNTVVQCNLHYDLHANEVGKSINSHRPFVASQAPLKKEQNLFWQAIFRGDFNIIDLTGELGRELPEPHGVNIYYPDKLNQILEFGAYQITLVEKNDFAIGGQIHRYKIIYGAEVEGPHRITKIVSRLHFTQWPDGGAITLPQLTELVESIEGFSSDPSSPLWIHCLAGVGRTGTLITAMILKEKIKTAGIRNEVDLQNYLLKTILCLRTERGPRFVQSKEQVDLLYQYAKSLLQER